MKPLNIFRTMLGLDSGIYICDTIEHEGALWLVPEWRHSLDERKTRPARLIRLSGHPFQKMTNPDSGADFLLNEPIPKETLDGAPTNGWQILLEPELWFEVPMLQ